uniref:CDC20/Fizzy WD40 domain-containing protein n=1 Tax=Phaeomonas parva TaxID=124430 RepID=A0A7S1TZ58_9STRA|eukprot:CAMPEP_0118864302 /NCGR_PEP_ID=MMETSP1163-20130328/8923_1 /TAXON_ID=124430 /ORGANISM="Phaeomonas parva, Strain CCMP2877" /LENGTH=486 /DNA_ID=CAMNT_0006798401 /DNA_START=167 /DNA_END=1627 /DNA_ORIENTATION=+
MAATSATEIAELEAIMSFDAPLTSKMPRWQRKQLAASLSGESGGAGDSSGEGTDRFIPSRANMDMDHSHYSVNSKENGENGIGGKSPAKASLNKALKNSLLDKGHRVLAFKNKAPAPRDGYENHLRVLYTANKGAADKAAVKSTRHIPSAPLRILDAPDLLDDYYLNLVSWSSTNTVAVALGPSVYLWDAATGGISELMTLEDESQYVSSVSWIQEGGTHLAVGTSTALTQLWDVSATKQVRSMDGHTSRVGALAWNQHLLASGSADTTVVNHDVRVRAHNVNTWSAHEQEVCGLSWSPDGSYLASGGNDNLLCVWDAASVGRSSSRAFHTLTDHQAAVKALAWSPHERNLLASGGGTADRSIKFWNAATGAMLSSIDTGSQVCALRWNPHEKEILSSHGFADNQLSLWKYPSMAKVKDLKGHTSRVLHMCVSPDGETVLSAAGDETLRFWSVFGGAGKKKKSRGGGGSGSSTVNSGSLNRITHIR